MSIKNILVQVGSSDRSAATVEAAASVARKFNARLNGFFVIPDVAVVAADSGGVAMDARIVEDLQKDAEKQSAAAETVFRDAAGDLATAGSWSQVDAMGIGSRAAAAKVARYADLIVAGPVGGGEENQSAIHAQDLVLDSGRPLLLVRDSRVEARNIVIAWSESREAARAVFDSLPFLAAAETVAVVTVVKRDGEDPAPGRRIAGVLEDHGIAALVATVTRKDGQSTSGALFDYAKRSGADLLVAGAYSHSRLREGLFGGVTKSIFEAAPVPVLLSH
jgi:nucleotide-binding universal stress UspA family protein